MYEGELLQSFRNIYGADISKGYEEHLGWRAFVMP